ncbi:class I SAM-dependent methyltransferase [Paenibacillus radicis (ex Xue et al. 2023)]|uniref:SAM-dependent methyltransferase n=1 Tax=Paenibacillus radicis (ex Xue et al. 2023) TaxID=2972489 RepID=A0ABT1YP84_9BACL|nr:SAM-dependent methyltransferase [Paenibacillus radicis (ex Xue et al. 2023)]MCR8634987.1 SAM-dependent methyltransferase [Paenibacillus radicis (ex Xue et al. 2023)]
MQEDTTLVGIIRRNIENSSGLAIPFRDYMELCLYHSENGYYMNNKDKIGRNGDFYTSAAIGGLFGEVLANYMASQAGQSPPEQPLIVVEYGGGTGQLARQLLDELKASAETLYKRLTYISVEASPHHRAIQEDRLAEHTEKVQWMTEQEWLGLGPWDHVIVFSNELLDAFPVHRVRVLQGKPYELYVEWDEEKGCFRDKLLPLSEGPVLDYISNQGVELQEGQQLEVNLEAIAWIHRIGHSIRQGQLVTIDYGDRSDEIYAAHRMNGTLISYRKHMAQDNPYMYPGEQDITSHVNFSSLINAGTAAGLKQVQFITQKQFLVENGLLQKLQDTASPDPFSPEARRNRAVRQLLLSDQMSELFKVLIQKKGELP